MKGGTKLLWLATALSLVLVLLAGAGPANAQATGVVKGRIVNKTAGGGPVGGQAIDLLAFADDGQREKRTATTGADGAFSFEGLATAGQKYILAVKYEGVTYHSEEIDLSKGQATREVEMAVYGTTTSASAISVSRSHMIVDYDTDKKNFVIIEIIIIANKGDRAYVGGDKKTADGKPETLRFSLPERAAQVTFNEGLNELQSAVVDGMVIDTQPVPPGQRQIVLSYVVPYQGSEGSLTRKFEYPAERVNVLVRETSAQVAAEGLPAKDVREMGTSRYVTLTGENLAAGQAIKVTFANIPASLPNPSTAGKPPAAAQTGDQNQLAALGVGLLGVGVVLGVAYPVLRRRRGAVAKPEAGGDEWDDLIDAIAALDDDFDAGKVGEAEYHRRRARLKARLQQAGRGARRT